MRRVHTLTELRAALAPLRAQGERIALVPTMGNLHGGHLSLVERARGFAPRVTVSVFVNPLQFGPTEDFSRYPRTLEADAAQLEAAGVDVLYAPDVDAMYPAGYPPAVSLKVSGALTESLEGEFRPGHFDGVATVVHRLFAQVEPDVAVFGEKDWQQLAVIRQLVRDFGLPLRIESGATLREADGLAMSSRNQYLSPEERPKAARLHAAMQQVAQGLAMGRRDFETLCEEASKPLITLGFEPQYLAVRALDFTPAAADGKAFSILAAAKLGRTRLIDNLQVALPATADGRLPA